jgi:hypothetical protein
MGPELSEYCVSLAKAFVLAPLAAATLPRNPLIRVE